MAWATKSNPMHNALPWCRYPENQWRGCASGPASAHQGTERCADDTLDRAPAYSCFIAPHIARAGAGGTFFHEGAERQANAAWTGLSKADPTNAHTFPAGRSSGTIIPMLCNTQAWSRKPGVGSQLAGLDWHRQTAKVLPCRFTLADSCGDWLAVIARR